MIVAATRATNHRTRLRPAGWSPGILILVQSAARSQRVERGYRRTGMLANAGLIGTNQLNADQRDVIALVIDEIVGCFIHRFSRQLVVIHGPLMPPMHSENVALPHTRSP